MGIVCKNTKNDLWTHTNFKASHLINCKQQEKRDWCSLHCQHDFHPVPCNCSYYHCKCWFDFLFHHHLFLSVIVLFTFSNDRNNDGHTKKRLKSWWCRKQLMEKDECHKEYLMQDKQWQSCCLHKYYPAKIADILPFLLSNFKRLIVANNFWDDPKWKSLFNMTAYAYHSSQMVVHYFFSLF